MMSLLLDHFNPYINKKKKKKKKKYKKELDCQIIQKQLNCQEEENTLKSM